MSSLLSAELSATCNALGTLNKKTGKYMIDDFTLNTVKDLIRYLRRDGEDHEIRRHFGQTKVLQTDLLPMLIDHWENSELFDVTLRLIVNLTNPALLLYREEVPVERTARHNYLQILSHLQNYKEEAFTKVDVWQMFSKKLAKVLEIDWSERDEDTGLIIERILILIRNVLHVPADLDKERRPENDASVHDQVLWALNQSGILDIILYMSSENEKQYFMHILEIISHLLREQNPTSLASAALQRSMDEKVRDEQELLTIRMTETKERQNKIRQFSGTRHSRFGGTYVVQNMKSISENEIISLKPLNNISSLDFNGSKKSRLVKPKNRRPVESGTLERRSAFAVRLFLKEFCIEFLNSSYNPLMHYVKDVLVRSRAQQNDESYYLWAVKFFMEFNRGHHFQVGLVSETMSVPMFHYVQQQMEKYYDMIKVEKKKFPAWVRRLHLSLRAYKELLNTLLAMDKSSDPTVKESAKVLKSNIFYVLEYREFILYTFLNYDDNKMPRSYLVDLVETVHLFLKMLEYYCKKTGLVVQKKVRKKSKSKKKKLHLQKAKQVAVEVPAWDVLCPQIACVLSAGVNEYPPPFDAASDIPIDQQKEDCMKKIQKLMRESKFEDAIGTFRAAREVWPEEGIFGVSGIAEDEELEMLQTIYNTDLGVEVNEVPEVEDESQDGYDNEEDDEEEEANTTSVVETDFDFQDFVQRFCQPRVVSACAYLLERYEKNSAYTNHCIIKMLHRIAWDCKRPSMMFQASMFLTFQKIFHNPLPHFKELEKFGLFVFRKFSEVALKNTKVFIELLFWKSSKDAIDIEHGYDLYSDQKDKVGKGHWSEEQEDELRNLFMENQTNPTTEKDVIDWILDNLIDQTRTRRGVIKKLKELGLIFKAPTKRSNKERLKEKVPKEFSEEEDSLLIELWKQYGDSSDPMGIIIPRMPRKRPRRSFVERLLELDLIQDKRQCRQKKQQKSKSDGNNSDRSDSSSSSSESDESDSDSNIRVRSPKIKKNIKKIDKRRTDASSNRKANKTVELSANEIAKLLVQAVNKGFSEALKWVAENLEEVALDQEAEGYDPSAEGTPLVPISDDSVQAMDNRMFHKVLKGVGILPPADEQETYWRIPSHLHFNTIRKRREIILKAINKELIINDAEISNTITAEESEKNEKEESSDDEDLFDSLRKLRDNNTEEYVNKSNNKTNTRKRSRSSDDEDNGKEKLQRIEEELIEKSDEEDILSFAKKTLQCDDEPDTEDILKSIPKHISDDSDNEDEEIVVTKRKKARVIVDDDSD
ncbi:PREDICTED: protein timeless homolog isoform X1 [Papilio xuthus]|uniref:Protein timeless homolog isoform X1 n=1 Tax=Papilio xuthus TaxID=66420 RepID=A0AAJ7E6N1_PAPXU|nr:PREDICTED: protein timeless homolog isoform X1 [Papilio xuthus]